MEGLDPKVKSTDEVDVTQIFKWIGRGFRNFGNSILFGIATLRHMFVSNRLYFAIIIIFGLSLGVVYHQLVKKESFRSTMVLGCEYLNTRILKNTIDKLNILCHDPERKALAE